MFTKILSPIDGSETAFQVSEFAIKFAYKQKASLFLLYVINERHIQRITSFSDKKYGELVEQFREQGNRFFQAILAQTSDISPKMDIHEVITIGDPAEEIIKFIQDNSIDLIIMPTKDEDHTARFSLGHVTSRVIESNICPTLAIPSKYSSMKL